MNLRRRVCSFILTIVTCVSFLTFQRYYNNGVITASAATISDFPENYKSAADWIWNNRIVAEDSTGSKQKRWNGMFDQIIDGNGTLNYVVRWHSAKTITYDQRQKLETALDECINAWTDWLVGYENWPYKHIDVSIVGWAVTDKSLLLDLHPDEIVYTDTVPYEIQNGESSEILPVMANAPSELSRFDHFTDENYEYPGGLDKRFDQYLWATQGFPDIGGCGGDWGQRLSDNYYIGLAEGTQSKHVQIHEVGHGFGFTDFYGGEGASDGFPPGGFPGNGSSIMMAGSSTEITDFDGWFMRYVWSKIKDEPGRFDLSGITPEDDIETAQFSDEITAVTKGNNGSVTFKSNGSYTFSGTDYYGGDEEKNLSNYDVGDIIDIKFSYNKKTSEIISIEQIKITHNTVTTATTTTTVTALTTTTTTTATTVTTNSKTSSDTTTTSVTTATTVTTANDIVSAKFSDKIDNISIEGNSGSVKFALNGTYTFSGTDYYGGDENKNLSHYEVGDVIYIEFTYNKKTTEIISIQSIDINHNSHKIKGDVNADNVFNITDVVLLQKWLLAVPSATLADWQAGDLYADGKLNVFDFIMMKRELLGNL